MGDDAERLAGRRMEEDVNYEGEWTEDEEVASEGTLPPSEAPSEDEGAGDNDGAGNEGDGKEKLADGAGVNGRENALDLGIGGTRGVAAAAQSGDAPGAGVPSGDEGVRADGITAADDRSDPWLPEDDTQYDDDGGMEDGGGAGEQPEEDAGQQLAQDPVQEQSEQQQRGEAPEEELDEEHPDVAMLLEMGYGRMQIVLARAQLLEDKRFLQDPGAQLEMLISIIEENAAEAKKRAVRASAGTDLAALPTPGRSPPPARTPTPRAAKAPSNRHSGVSAVTPSPDAAAKPASLRVAPRFIRPGVAAARASPAAGRSNAVLPPSKRVKLGIDSDDERSDELNDDSSSDSERQ